jgi:hypothetical protein
MTHARGPPEVFNRADASRVDKGHRLPAADRLVVTRILSKLQSFVRF